MREPKLYREEYERIHAAFPGHHYLTIREVAAYLGCSPNTAKKRFPFITRRTGHAGCTKAQLARALAEDLL